MTDVHIGEINDVKDGHALVVPPEKTGHDQAIAVFRQGEEFFAVDDLCTHLDASLGRVVTCWLHKGTFDVRTGEALDYPARGRLGTHDVELRGEEIWLSVR